MPRFSKEKKLIFGILFFFILLSWILRFCAKNFDCSEGFIRFSTIYRSAQYLIIFTVWGVTLYYRIIQNKFRSCLITVATLMVFWMLIRAVKFCLPEDANVYVRGLWYCYYIPCLLLPVVIFWGVLYLNKPEDYVLPAYSKMIVIPSLIFIGFVLTNDFHELIFSFPQGIFFHDIYHEMPLYFILHGWMYIINFTSFFIMAKKCRIPGSKKMIKIPMFLAVILIVYEVLYVFANSFINSIVGDVSLVECVLLMLIIESCIQCGLIPSNTLYSSLIKVAGLPVRVVDEEGQLLYETDHYEDKPDGMLRTSSAGLKKGRVFWQEDLSKLNELTKLLTENNEELNELHDMLKEEYVQKEKKARIEEKNRLYDRLQEQTVPQIDMLSSLIKELEVCDEDDRARELLNKVVVIGAYLKRKNNLILIMDENGNIPAEELERAFMESVNISNATGTKCGMEFPFTGMLKGEAVSLYDFFEQVIERTFDRLDSFFLLFEQAKDKLCMRISMNGRLDEALFRDIENVEFFMDEDSICYLRFEIPSAVMPEREGSYAV